jgi:CRISPR-associated protein Cst2
MSHTVLGFVLIDAPHSALNNAGMDAGARTENTVAVKTIRRGGRVYPYVSAQAWRFWWRTTLEARSGWTLSPVIRQAKVAFTSANPFTYPDDDVFGYMRAQREQDGGTLTRISPLKCSPLVAVTDQSPVDDFGVMARQRDGDPVPFEHQFYAVTLKGIFSLDLSGVGMFGALPKTGYKNLDDRYVARPEMQQAIQATGAVRNGNESWQLPRALRLQRVRDTLAVLPYLGGGAKLTLHLTDVTPKLIILAIIDGGNHLFMNITHEDDQRSVNTAALCQVLTDYRDIILSDVFIGRQEGFQDALAPDLSRLVEELHPLKPIHLASPRQAIEEFIVGLDRFVE